MLTIRSREEVLQASRDKMIDELIYPLDTDPTKFNEAFKTKFKVICDDIAAFLHLEGEEKRKFHGSLDDIMKLETFILEQDPSTDVGREAILKATVLEARWNSADKLCRYLGQRLGWRQPQWFEEGWKLFDDSLVTEDTTTADAE